jgi:hypothetical protein
VTEVCTFWTPLTFLEEVAARGIVRGRSNPDNFKATLGGPLERTYAERMLVRGDGPAARLADYEARWRAEISDELADSVRIQRRLFANPARADAIIRAAALDPLVALGEASPRRHRLEMAWRFFLAKLRSRWRRAG